MTQTYTLFKDGKGMRLITVGNPVEVSWWAEGRRATREEVEQSVESGFPLLLETTKQEQDPAEALAELMKAKGSVDRLYPAA
jgi:hypothetical protein